MRKRLKLDAAKTGSTAPGQEAPPDAPETKPGSGRVVVISLAVLAIAVATYFALGKPSETTSVAKSKTVPVMVQEAVAGNLPIEVHTTGNVQPFSVVNIMPQVGGQIIAVRFTQGQWVKKGDLLFQIDPSPYEALLAQAKGNVAKDQAQVETAQANLQRDMATVGQLQANMHKDEANLRLAKVEHARYKQLAGEGAISMEQADQALTTSNTAEAQMESARKQIENAQAVLSADKSQIATAKGTLQADEAVARHAQIQLDWCSIRSPIDGRTGTVNVQLGNVVQANNATPLVTIAQVRPVYISFTVPEDHLDDVRKALSENKLNIQAIIGRIRNNFVSGTASFLENTVNTASGTALLRATFANEDLKLYPGQYVDVTATMPAPFDDGAVVIPAEAVQTTQKGDAVYTIGKDNKAVLSPIKVSRIVGDRVVIKSGLNPGDLVVTDGAVQLTAGASVKIANKDSDKQGASSEDKKAR